MIDRFFPKLSIVVLIKNFYVVFHTLLTHFYSHFFFTFIRSVEYEISMNEQIRPVHVWPRWFATLFLLYCTANIYRTMLFILGQTNLHCFFILSNDCREIFFPFIIHLLFVGFSLIEESTSLYKIKSRDWSRSCCLKAVEPRFSVLFTTRTNTLPRDFLSQPLELTQAFPYASLVCYCWIWMGSTRSPHPRGYILVRQSF